MIVSVGVDQTSSAVWSFAEDGVPATGHEFNLPAVLDLLRSQWAGSEVTGTPFPGSSES